VTVQEKHLQPFGIIMVEFSPHLGYSTIVGNLSPDPRGSWIDHREDETRLPLPKFHLIAKRKGLIVDKTPCQGRPRWEIIFQEPYLLGSQR